MTARHGGGGTYDASPVANAIRTVAAQVLHNVLSEELTDKWDSYPEIGENDWQRVVQECLSYLPPQPAMSEFVEAYTLLQERAEES